MNLKYKHLSLGYIGKTTEKMTLNSLYYSSFNTDPEKIDNIILFPQRIPKIGFFKELYELENAQFKASFNAKVYDIIFSLQKFARDLSINYSEKSERSYINLANLCLRYGCFEDINAISHAYDKHLFSLEMAFLHESSLMDCKLSKDLPVSADNYIALANRFLPCFKTTEREKIKLLNLLIVTFYRHQRDKSNSKQVFNYAIQLIKLIEVFENNEPINQLYSSVAYRGLAMVNEFGPETQQSFLNKAEAIALRLLENNTVNKIISLENIYICFQSIAKWYLYNEDFDKAEAYLKKMIAIDPLDSTGHSELGFLYIRKHIYDSAADSFKMAMDLGPPGVGMHAYYYAKCLYELGKNYDAVAYLYLSAESDNEALSPWLELLSYNIEHNDIVKAKEIAKHIYKSPILFEQLSKDEIHTIQNLII